MSKKTIAIALIAVCAIGGALAPAAAYATNADKAAEMWRRRQEDTRRIPREFSKIRLKIAIAQLGKLDALEQWLSSFEVAPGYTALEAWNDAQVISDDFEGFDTFFEAAKVVLGVDDAQAEAILAASVAQ